MHQDIEKLASQILYHKKLYYAGQSILSDQEYDYLEDKLRELSPNHQVLSYVGVKTEHNKAKHSHLAPMLSLEKTYDQKVLLQFISKYPCIAIDKFDGMAVSLRYDRSGRLNIALTRGDGRYGEDVTRHIAHIIAIPQQLTLNTPLAQNIYCEIRGEIYFPLSKFKNYANKFDSLRNAVPGTLGRKNIAEVIDILNCFAFCPYDILLYKENGIHCDASEVNNILQVNFSYLQKINFLRQLGFNFYAQAFQRISTNVTQQQLDVILTTIFNAPRDYLIDGIVFRIDDESIWEGLGNTFHHPRGSLAFKQAGETAQTEIIAIEENIGRSGKISFRAKLKPVFLSGATISYATLHNAQYIEQGNYCVGAQVEIIRSGEVIPAIINLIKPGPQGYSLPLKCKCGAKLVRQGPELMCLENDSCYYKDQEILAHFVACLRIKGISDKIIAKLRQAELLNEPADLYRITIEDLLQLEGFAQKSAENIVRAIQSNKILSLATFLTALGLKRGGRVKCQEIATKFLSLDKIRQLTAAEILILRGWAEKSAVEFIDSLRAKHQLIDNLLRYVKVLDESNPTQFNPSQLHRYYNKNICITGNLSVPREEYRELLNKIGAKLVNTVSANTHFLVCDAPSNSVKYLAACRLGIPIVTEQEFKTELYNDIK